MLKTLEMEITGRKELRAKSKELFADSFECNVSRVLLHVARSWHRKIPECSMSFAESVLTQARKQNAVA